MTKLIVAFRKIAKTALQPVCFNKPVSSTCTHGASAAGRPPVSATATTRQPAAEFTAGLKIERCEKSYAVLYFSHSSGDIRTLPPSRKPGSVKEPKRAADINPLNAELNPICYLLVLLGDLTFMGPCIVSIFKYISNKMQRYTVYLYLETALHVSGGTSTHH